VSDAAFYFDLASPHAYLAAEQVLQILPGPAEWQPVLAAQLPDHGEQIDPAELAARARELGLQPLRLPQPCPFDSELAMRVATYAKAIGRAVPFAQAAFRQAYAGGHDLAGEDFVLISAAACEMHPNAVLRAARTASIGERLARASADAARAGVRSVPAVRVADEVFSGRSALADAALRMAGA